MRSPLPALVRTALVGMLAIPLLAGCSKKTVAPNSLPQPEGQQNDQVMMLGWQEQPSYWFSVLDPGTPQSPLDDFLGTLGADYWKSPSAVRCMALDLSPSNQLEIFRQDPDGNAKPLFDYPLNPQFRFIGSGIDLFEFSDLDPPSAPVYHARGLFDGVSTTSSPLSNRVEAAGPVREDLQFLVDPIGGQNDSTLDVRFSEDPAAAFYLVEIRNGSDVMGSGSSFSIERRLRGIPSTLLPGTRSRTSVSFLMPPGSGATGISVEVHATVEPFRLTLWPMVFYIRVSAYDAKGRMINRVNQYLASTTRDGKDNVTLFEPLGGAVQTLSPYPGLLPPPPNDAPVVLTNRQAFDRLRAVGGSTPTEIATLSTSSAIGSYQNVSLSSPFMSSFTSRYPDPNIFANTLRSTLAAIRTGSTGTATVRTAGPVSAPKH